MTELTPHQADYSAVRADIVALLDAARRAAARTFNAVMTATYWSLGRRIVEFEQGGQERAVFGADMIKRLGADLNREFGRGFGWRNLAQMRAFYLSCPGDQILQTPSAISAALPISLTLSEKSAAPRMRQMLSGESTEGEIVQTTSGQSLDLAALAQAFPLPRSAYVRLLSVKTRRRVRSMRLGPCAVAGPLRNAIAIAQTGDAGRFGSHRFISCRADSDNTSAEFLRYYFLTDDGMLKIGEASPGGAGRNRTLGLEKLMSLEVPVPSLAAQQTFDRLQAEVTALKAQHTAIRQANDVLLPATLERLFAGRE